MHSVVGGFGRHAFQKYGNGRKKAPKPGQMSAPSFIRTPTAVTENMLRPARGRRDERSSRSNKLELDFLVAVRARMHTEGCKNICKAFLRKDLAKEHFIHLSDL